MPMIEDMEDVQQAGLCCPQCAAANLPQRKFCAKCGAALWESCLQCGDLAAAGETYCGACGANLRRDRRRSPGTDRGRLPHRRRDAVRLPVRPCHGPVGPHHQAQPPPAGRARSPCKTTHSPTGRPSAIGGGWRPKKIAVGRGELYDAFDFDGAARILDELPPSLRNQDIVELARMVAARREEIAALSDELRAAVRQKRVRRSAVHDRAVAGPEARSCPRQGAGRPGARAPCRRGEETPGRASLRPGDARAGTNCPPCPHAGRPRTPPPRQ